ncbi:MAG: hypothetical protein OEV67_12875 [Betaproteobacteria bacterium]|nr:hypothetical protein [Betaproteobacteria bacterium]
MSSAKASAKNRKTGALNKPDPVVPKSKAATASRSQVRQEIHRTQVPRQSQRPGERSNQRRSGKP